MILLILNLMVLAGCAVSLYYAIRAHKAAERAYEADKRALDAALEIFKAEDPLPGESSDPDMRPVWRQPKHH